MERISIVLFVAFLGLVAGNVLNYKVTEQKEENAGVHWALLVAGSYGWGNYRHQADACHAYQIMIKNGIAPERIVTMMYDDIAHNQENPTPGIVINKPNGPDVYKGVVIDYKQDDVTPENFLRILAGNQEAMNGIGSGKVIKSGPNDHVFVNFVDHGAPGIVAFPRGELHARDLMNTVQKMYDNYQYAEMVFYIEACESGSMFDGLLPNDIYVFATTAANAHESSYACYYDKERRTYLGDVYSVKWMEDSDQEDLKSETLQKQFSIVKQETNTSHVMEYGDMSISKEPVADFQGGASYVFRPELVVKSPKITGVSTVASEDVPVAILQKRLEDAKSDKERSELRRQLEALIEERKGIQRSMKAIVSMAAGDHELASKLLSVRKSITQWDCYEQAAMQYDDQCYDLSQYDYAMRHLYALVNLCEERIPTDTILESISKVCK